MRSKPGLVAKTTSLQLQQPVAFDATADNLALASIGWGLTVITSFVIFVAIITTFAASHI
jgi:hypothetical protein